MFLAISDRIFLPIIVLIICTLAAIIILVLCIVHRRKTRSKPALSEIDILSALKDSKVFPVEYSNGWKLYDYVNGQQLWSHDLQMLSPSPPPLPPSAAEQQQHQQQAATVFACFSKVKGSPQMVLNILKDTQKHEHWTLNPRPMFRADSVQAESAKNSVAGGRQIVPSVCHDVICIQVTDDDSSSSRFILRRLLKRLRWLPLRLRPNSAQVATIQRFWQREENGCCWLLEYESDAEEWTFCLMQPIEGWFETDRCMLTILFSFGQTQTKQRMRTHCDRMAVKLCSVRDYLQNRRVQTIPLVRLSLSYPENETTPPDGSSAGGLVLTSPDNSKSKESKSASKDPSQDVSLLQKFKNMIELKRESYEVEKRRKAARAMSSASVASSKQDVPTGVSIQNPFDLLRKLSPSKSIDQVRGGGGGKIDAGETKRNAEPAKEQMPVKKDISEYGGKEEDDQKMNSGAKNVLRRRMPLLNEIGRSKSVKSNDIYKEPEISEKVEEKEVDAQKSRGSPSEETPESSAVQSPDSVAQPSKDSDLESQLKLIAEATIGDLIVEKGRVSQLNITSSYKEQAKTTGGWMYRGLEKDTVILQKEVDDDNPVHSYLGKGMVPASPKLVYEILRKPHSRRTYDNWLQKVQVLHEFESGLKIVYMYHEGTQSSKKKCHDLCLLQSEKCEGKRYIISLHSVDWPECKELENVARVKMELGSNQGSSDYLDEFASKQPVCIIALRQYVATLNETTSNEHLLTTDNPQPMHSLSRNSLPSAAS